MEARCEHSIPQAAEACRTAARSWMMRPMVPPHVLKLAPADGALMALLATAACAVNVDAQEDRKAGREPAGGASAGASVEGTHGTAPGPDGGALNDGFGTGGAGPCPTGVICVETFPFVHQGDTAASGTRDMQRYSCAPDVDESGREQLYRVTVEESGFLSAAVYDDQGVDIDVHLLDARDPDRCLDRGHRQAAQDVHAGTYWITADSFVDDQSPLEGPYELHIGLSVPSRGDCEMQVGLMPRVNDGGVSLPMPATGPIVKEAHLVTDQEPEPYPQSPDDQLAEHYVLSQSATGFVMHRQSSWAPLEGGHFYGAGIGSPQLLPVTHEAWYVNMYWRSAARPERGTKMILQEPGGSRAVVVAAGYETGPGNLAHIGGAPEEVHFYMGTDHLSELTLGMAVDPGLPLGPRECN